MPRESPAFLYQEKSLDKNGSPLYIFVTHLTKNNKEKEPS